MSFHNVRFMRRIGSPARAELGTALTYRRKSSGCSFNSVELRSQGSSALNETVIALLDRDSELRHLHLQRRWQGVIS